MKVGIIASVLIHVGGLALVPSQEATGPKDGKSVAEECRCDYEFTITDARAPRALTLGEVPAARFSH